MDPAFSGPMSVPSLHDLSLSSHTPPTPELDGGTDLVLSTGGFLRVNGLPVHTMACFAPLHNQSKATSAAILKCGLSCKLPK